MSPPRRLRLWDAQDQVWRVVTPISGGALARLKVWVREVLTFAALNAEFDNIISNGLSLINPLTGNLACGDNDLTGIDELALTDATANASAAGRLRRNAAALSWHNGTSAQNVILAALASGTQDISSVDEVVFTDATANASADGRLRRNATNLTFHDGTQARVVLSDRYATMAGNVGIIPAAVSGTPTQHGLFRENVVKGWIRCDYTGGISDSFNVVSITDGGVGLTTVTWDRDFADTTYVVLATVHDVGVGGPRFASTAGTRLVGSVQVETFNPAGALADGVYLDVLAIGDQ